MSGISDGGPAFPCPERREVDSDLPQYGAPGMTLRDYFAGQALAGVLADHNVEGTDLHAVAEYVFEMADAMLAARGGGA